MSPRSLLIALGAALTPLVAAQTVPLSSSPQLAVPKSVVADAQINPCAQFSTSTPLLLPRTTVAAAGLSVRSALVDGIPTGNGPLLDVFSRSPDSRAPRGGELVLTGRAFPVGKVAARIGATQLELLGSTTSEARFQIPATLTVENQPLVVWQENGTPRTLTSAYTVFDPTIRIYGVVPASFAKGERVRLCGKGLNNLAQASPTPSIPVSQRLRIGDGYIDISNAVVSSDGSSMTFVAGGPDVFMRTLRRIGSTDQVEAVFVKAPASTQTLEGRVGLTSAASPIRSTDLHQTDVYSPGEVSWNAVAALRLNGFYSTSVFGSTPFVLLSRTEAIRNQLVIEGTGLEAATFTVGGRSLVRAAGSAVGNQVVVRVSPDTTSGELCAQVATVRRCHPSVLRVGRMPEIVSSPATVAAGAEATLLGLALLPDPMIAGLSYRWVYVPGDCASTLELLEHSDARVRLRIPVPPGDAARARCSGRSLRASLELRGTYENEEVTLLGLPITVTYP